MTYETASLIGSVVLVVSGPIGLILAATLIGRRSAGGPSLQLVVVGGFVASVMIFWFGGIAFNWLIPPPYDPAFADGRGLDLRGIGFVMASMLGGFLTFVVALVYGLVLGYKRRRRQAEEASLKDRESGNPVA